jgi:phage terminase large subunit-like protein
MTATLTRGSKSSAKPLAPALSPTLGPQVCRWMERNLVHGPGDKFGQPYRLDRYMREFVWRAYELNPDGSRRYTRGILGVAKGNAKTELAAGISCAELGGPVVFDRWDASGRPVGRRRVSPDIPVAAASFDQADLLFGCARVMIKEGPLRDFFEVYDTEILVKGDAGRMYRVAAVAGTNDGARPTFFPADELHEWTGNKERVHLVLSNGRSKRADSWELSITTAGWDVGSLLGRKYLHGKRVLADEAKDDALLFVWFEPSTKDVDLGDPVALRAAIREANPASFINVEAIAQRATEIPEFEFRRYHLNQWVDSPERWLPYGTWDACRVSREVPADDSDIVLALDGTYDCKSVAIVGATTGSAPHVFVVKAWEEGFRGDPPTIEEVESALRDACARWRVLRLGMDKGRWRSTLERLEQEGLPVMEWKSRNSEWMVQACAQFFDAVTQKRLTHDGDERMTAHIANAVVKVDSRGPRIAKEYKDSLRHIDLAVAGIAAYDLAVRESNVGTWEFSTFDLGK